MADEPHQPDDQPRADDATPADGGGAQDEAGAKPTDEAGVPSAGEGEAEAEASTAGEGDEARSAQARDQSQPASEAVEADTPEQEDPLLKAARAAVTQANNPAEAAAASAGEVAENGDEAVAGAKSPDLPEFSDAPSSPQVEGLDLLADVNLDVKIELGRTRMYVEDVLRLGEGAVVELDKLAGDPVDVHVNGQLIGRGEVLVLNDNFCVRINEIVTAGVIEASQQGGRKVG